MNPWDTYKKWFHTWEQATSKYTETLLQSPLLLEPAGAWLTAFMKMKANGNKAVERAWAAAGLATKHDQERTLHALNQIQSRLIDLEEQLADMHDARPEPAE